MSVKSKQEAAVEVGRCLRSFAYFVKHYCHIYDGKEFVLFDLWPGQMSAVRAVTAEQKLIILKARQLGMTWLCLAYALWLMNFNDHRTVLLFSLRDEEAKVLVQRLHQMWERLPDWMRVHAVQNAHSINFMNGSIAKGFPTTAGDSYNASLAIVDEADLVPDLDRLMGRVKPTIDGGGKLFLVSRVDKSNRKSTFQSLYRDAVEGRIKWGTVFLPWSVRPERDQAWYDEQVAYSLATAAGTLDWVHEQYPNTAEEALAPKSLDKRIPPTWLLNVYKKMTPVDPMLFKPDAAAYPQLRVYVTPDPRRTYTIGGDPAQGNPNSDDSACVVLDDETGEEVASLAAKIEPGVFAAMMDRIGIWYNKAPLMVERNNHGHAVLMWLKDHGKCRIVNGPDENPGFQTMVNTKVQAYDKTAEDIRVGNVIVHDPDTYEQLGSIEAATLSAPDGDMFHDDKAMAFVLANWARKSTPKLPPLIKRDYQKLSVAQSVRNKILA